MRGERQGRVDRENLVRTREMPERGTGSVTARGRNTRSGKLSQDFVADSRQPRSHPPIGPVTTVQITGYRQICDA